MGVPTVSSQEPCNPGDCNTQSNGSGQKTCPSGVTASHGTKTTDFNYKTTTPGQSSYRTKNSCLTIPLKVGGSLNLQWNQIPGMTVFIESAGPTQYSQSYVWLSAGRGAVFSFLPFYSYGYPIGISHQGTVFWNGAGQSADHTVTYWSSANYLPWRMVASDTTETIAVQDSGNNTYYVYGNTGFFTAEGGDYGVSPTAPGRLLRRTDRNGNTLFYNYRYRSGDTGHTYPQILDTITGDLGGATIKFGYRDETVGNPNPISWIQLTDALSGSPQRLTYFDYADVTSFDQSFLQAIRYPDGCVSRYKFREYGYEGHTLIVAETDPNNFTTYFDSLAATSQIYRVIESDGRTTYYNYPSVDGTGTLPFRTAMAVAGRPNTTYYGYQLSGGGTLLGQLLKRQRFDGLTSYYQWDPVLNRTTRQITESGATTYYQYTANFEASLISESNGGSVYRNRQYLYFANGLDKRVYIAPRFLAGVPDVTYFAYTPRGSQKSVTMPLGRTAYYLYTPNVDKARGNLDAKGKATYFNFDATYGSLVSQVDRGNNQTLYKYNGYGDLLRVVSPRYVEQSAAAFTTYYDYTQRSLRRRSIDPLGNATYFDYDSRTDPIATVDPRGVTSMTSYTPVRKMQRQWVLPAGSATAASATYYDYNQLRLLRKQSGIMSPSQWTATYYLYDLLDRQVTQTDLLGHITYYGYNLVGNQVVERDALGHQRLSTYDLLQRRTTYVDANLAQTYFGYDLGDLLNVQQDALGRRTSFAFDAASRLYSMTDPLTDKTYYGYDLNDNLVLLRNARSASTVTTYTALDQTQTIVDALANKTYFGYDAAGNRIVVRDARSNTTKSSYDRLDRLSTVTTPDTAVSYFGYDGVGNLVASGDPRGNRTLASYDALSRRQLVTDAAGGQTYYGYDMIGNRVNFSDPLHNRAKASFDALSRLQLRTDAANGQAYFGYDAVGNLIRSLDPRGNLTQAAYDPENRIQVITNAASGKTYYGYDQVGNRIKFRDARANVSTAAYDKLNRPTLITDPLANTAYFGYDQVGNRTKVTNGLNHLSQWTFDLVNRPFLFTNGANQTSYFGYDQVGNGTKARNPLGNAVTLAYDQLNRVSQITNPLNQAVSFAYDRAGNRVKEIDGLNQSTYFAYDQLNRLIGITDPLNNTSYFAYDAASNLTFSAVRTPSRAPINIAYDVLNRKCKVTDTWNGTFGYGTQPYGTSPYGGGGYNDSYNYFTYDAVGNLATMLDSGGASAFGYDALNRRTKRQFPRSGTAYYQYDPVSNRTAIQYPGTTLLAQSVFDNANRQVKLLSPDNKAAYFVYDKASNISKRRFGNGSTCYYFYDAAERVTGIHHLTSAGAPIVTMDYQRDAAGRIVKIARETDLAIYYGYDTADRLVQELWAKKSTSAQIYAFCYQYDAAGNRQRHWRFAAPNVVTEKAYFTYNAANAPIKRWVAPSNVASYFTYDGAGNLTGLLVGTSLTYFAYAMNGFISEIRPPATDGPAWTFGYDGLLNRARILKGTTASYYAWDGMNQLEERDPTGTLLSRYSHGPTPIPGIGSVMEVHRQTSTTTYFQYLHMDHQGTVKQVTDVNQTVELSYVTDAFGRQIVPVSGANTKVPNDLQFQSNWLTVQIGTRWYGISPSRVYDPELGRFLQRDLMPSILKVLKPRILLGNRGGIFDYSIFAQTISKSYSRDLGGTNLYATSICPNDIDPSGLVYQGAFGPPGPPRPSPSDEDDIPWNASMPAKPPVYPGFENARYQQLDRKIANAVQDFNQNKQDYCGCTSDQGGGVPDLDPALVKAWLIQETGGNRSSDLAAWRTDPAQVNVPGDWNPYKADAGLSGPPASRNTGNVDDNLKAALKTLCRKGFGKSGAPAANRPTGTFDDWKTALKRYGPPGDFYSNRIWQRYSNPGTPVPIQPDP
jgi:YD repeat-containing protein